MDYKLFVEMISGLYQLGTRNNTLEKHKERDDFFYRETLIFLLDIEKVGRLICENGGRENYRIESYLNVIEQQLEQKWLFESLFFLKKNKNIHARYVKCFYEALDKTIKDFGNLVKSGNRHAIKTLVRIFEANSKSSKTESFLAENKKKNHSKIKEDLKNILLSAKFLFALTFVIRFNFNEVIHNSFNSIIAAYLEFLETNESVVRVYYKTVTGKGNEVICFVVILFQEGFEQYREETEEDWIRSQLSFYKRQEYHYTINIEVENWNKKFLYTTTSDSKTILNYSTFSNNSADYAYTLGFLFMLDNLESSIVLEERAKDIFFKKVKNVNNVNNNQRVVSDLLSSNKYNLWDIKHLSENAQKYILNLFIVYKEFIFNEYLLSTEIKKTYELILKIETFMLSVQESSRVAFNSISDKKKARDFKPEWLDDLALRTFYQFISLLSYHKEIIGLYEFKYCSEFISKFLEVFQEQNGIENFLMYDLSYKIMEESENYITAFKCHDLYFNRRQGINRDYRESRLIDIPIYQNRIIKIQDYIKYAFQKDCLVICCEVTCSANSPVEHKKLSDLLYQMFHSGKRKAPLSKLRGYLGYWAEKRDGENPTYYARIYFIFNQEVTFDYPNLSQEIEDAWNKAIKKKYVNDDYDGTVKPIVIMKSVDLLNKKQLVVERINKRLQKLFFENVVPYVVFQNVIYSEFYTKTPKWLIRGTTPKK